MKRFTLNGLRFAGVLAAVILTANACTIREEGGGKNNGFTGATTGSGGAPTSGGTKSTTTGGYSSTQGGSKANSGGSTSTGTGGSTSSSKGGGSNKVTACNGVAYTGKDDSGADCEGFQSETEAVPVDMYIMMDRSISMNQLIPNTNTTRWDAIRSAMEEFVAEASKEDLRAGIGFFGASQAAEDAIDCNTLNYSTPKVEIAQVKDNGPDLVEAIDANQPGGLTPTFPALKGAIEHAKTWASSGKAQGRQVIVVLVTDGYPTQCQDPVSIAKIAELAEVAHDTSPSIRTYVVGLAAGFNLDAIAQSGGSDTAYLLDEGDVTSSLVSALLNITNSKTSCQFEVPTTTKEGMEVDPDKVQLLFTPHVGDQEEVPRIDSGALCDRNPNGGWFYDNPASPKMILTCPCTCSRISQAGTLNLGVGCKPTYGIR